MPAWSPRARLSLGALALFALTLLAAVGTYPGGSWLRPHAHDGFSWSENFWCDLLREPAYNGGANGRAVWLTTLSFVLIALGLAPFWFEVSTLLAEGQRRFVRVAGSVSSIATACVALLPSDRFPALHAPAVLTAGGLGFACGCVCSAWALRHPRQAPAFRLFSCVLLAAASLNLVLYVWVVYFDGPSNVVLPSAQKVATVALIGWIVSGLVASARRPKP